MVKMVMTAAIARDCNNEVCQMTKDYPTRFARFRTLPMQDVRATIAELDGGMVQLDLKRGTWGRSMSIPHTLHRYSRTGRVGFRAT
jgi:hypothetical protein